MEGFIGNATTEWRKYNENESNVSCSFDDGCGRPDDAGEEEPYSHAKEIARKALNRQLKNRSDGALYFHHRKVTPNWSNEYIRTVEVGEHVFYKPAGGKAK